MRFDGNGDAVLFLPDLVSVSRLRTRAPGADADAWSDWPAGAYLLYPLDAAPTQPGGRPYTRIAAAARAGRRFPVGRAAVSITGVWGYGSVRQDTGLRIAAGAALTADATTIAAAPANTAVSAGHTIRIDAEDLYVTAAAVDRTADTTTLTAIRGVNGATAAPHDAGPASRRIATRRRCPNPACAW